MQRVRAPRIHVARTFKTDEWKSFDTNRMSIVGAKAPDSTASWVEFGAFLGGYGVKFETDSNITVSNAAAYLPVSKTFLAIFALMGRFSDEPDRRRKVRGSGVRTWDRRVSRRLSTNEIEISVLNGQGRLPAGVAVRQERVIHGLTGSLYFKSPEHEPVAGDIVKSSWSVAFVGESLLEPLQIAPDSLGLETIGMLCLGFLPFNKDCFVNVLDPLSDDDNRSENSTDSDSDRVARGFRVRRHSERTRVRDAFDVEAPKRRARLGSVLRFKSNSNEPEVNVVAYELLAITVTEAEILKGLPRQENTKCLALYEMTLDAKTRSELRDLDDQSYIPASEPWLRLKRSLPKYMGPCVVHFIKRADAQMIAKGLLEIIWHQEGYLIPGLGNHDEWAKVLELLCSISERTRPFLIRLKEGVSALDMSSRDEQGFLAVAEPVIRRAISTPTRRSLLEVLFDLDEFLKPLQHDRPEVQQMVGILMLTNKEFTELVYQSARHMTHSSQVRIELDLRAGTMVIPSTFGTTQTFELDMEVLYGDNLQLGALGKISAKHSDILKAALRAYVRSLMLASCYDAEPLTECLESITSDTLYMA
ncbi:hypothetical protein M7I_3066 [Glarea lozoyensis 74030]|nr:hypothetical protein M7I_3066 [Glarea lozoyensis 74030]